MSLFDWLLAGGIFKIWSFGSRGSLRNRLRRNCKKENSENNPEGRYFFDDYIPKRYNISDDYSKRILKLKKEDQNEIEKFANKFEFLNGLSNLVIIRVPSHEAGKENGMEGAFELALDRFPAFNHEPYYKDYAVTNLVELFEEAGLRHEGQCPIHFALD